MKKFVLLVTLVAVLASSVSAQNNPPDNVPWRPPCSYDWLRWIGYPIGAFGGGWLGYGIVNSSEMDGETWATAGAMFGIGWGLVVISNLACKQPAFSSSQSGIENVLCSVTEHVRVGISPDGKQSYAGVRFSF